jgi:hypothetical protein
VWRRVGAAAIEGKHDNAHMADERFSETRPNPPAPFPKREGGESETAQFRKQVGEPFDEQDRSSLTPDFI